jgi:hypothetical protein
VMASRRHPHGHFRCMCRNQRAGESFEADDGIKKSARLLIAAENTSPAQASI